MKCTRLILILIGLFPLYLSANEIVLYSCTIDGKTTLQSEACDKQDRIKEYHYSAAAMDADKSDQEKPSGLREGEKKLLNSFVWTPSKEQIVDRLQDEDPLGLAAYMDSRHFECSIYTAQLNDALNYIHVRNSQLIEIGPLRTAELHNQIDEASRQVKYYCD